MAFTAPYSSAPADSHQRTSLLLYIFNENFQHGVEIKEFGSELLES